MVHWDESGGGQRGDAESCQAVEEGLAGIQMGEMAEGGGQRGIRKEDHFLEARIHAQHRDWIQLQFRFKDEQCFCGSMGEILSSCSNSHQRSKVRSVPSARDASNVVCPCPITRVDAIPPVLKRLLAPDRNQMDRLVCIVDICPNRFDVCLIEECSGCTTDGVVSGDG